MKVLFSIKPKFASKIFEGIKRFESRRLVFKSKEVSKIVVYASAPISKVIVTFEIEHIIQKEFEELLDETKNFSGITKTYFDQYFIGKEEGFAISVKNPKLYESPQNLKEKFDIVTPQSFAYMK